MRPNNCILNLPPRPSSMNSNSPIYPSNWRIWRIFCDKWEAELVIHSRFLALSAFCIAENKLEINILDASIKKIETKNKEAKKYEEKDIFYYEIFYLVEYNLYDDTNYLIASTIVESFRSTTSGRFISIIET